VAVVAASSFSRETSNPRTSLEGNSSHKSWVHVHAKKVCRSTRYQLWSFLSSPVSEAEVGNRFVASSSFNTPAVSLPMNQSFSVVSA